MLESSSAGELHPTTGLTQQNSAGLLLQQGQLLRHRGRAVGQRLGDGGHRATDREFPEQQQSVHIQHGLLLASAELMDIGKKRSLFFTLLYPNTRGKARVPTPGLEFPRLLERSP
jgi:hypothetical protein